MRPSTLAIGPETATVQVTAERVSKPTKSNAHACASRSIDSYEKHQPSAQPASGNQQIRTMVQKSNIEAAHLMCKAGPLTVPWRLMFALTANGPGGPVHPFSIAMILAAGTVTCDRPLKSAAAKRHALQCCAAHWCRRARHPGVMSRNAIPMPKPGCDACTWPSARSSIPSTFIARSRCDNGGVVAAVSM